MGRVYLSGLIDDYFPDYQSDCGFVILLNGGLAQRRRWIPLFLLNFSGASCPCYNGMKWFFLKGDGHEKAASSI